jgi:hypothetical protein
MHNVMNNINVFMAFYCTIVLFPFMVPLVHALTDTVKRLTGLLLASARPRST